MVIPSMLKTGTYSFNDFLQHGTYKQKIKDAPAFESAEKLNRVREEAIFEHDGLAGYWARKPKAKITSGNYPNNPLF